MRNLLVAAALLLCAASPSRASATDVEIPSLRACPQSEDRRGWWWSRLSEKDALVKAGGSSVVFLGDSITHGWDVEGRTWWEKYFAGEPYRALSLGFGGDRTEHVLWRIAHGQLDGYRARVIVLMIGTNNTGHRSLAEETPIDTILGIRAILDALRERQPDAKVVLHPIFPRAATADSPLRRRNERVNRGIREFADGRRIIWVDFNDQFLTVDGRLSAEVMPDRLHPGGIGREIWANALIPYLNYVLAGDGTLLIPSRFAPRIDASVTEADGKLGVCSVPRTGERDWLKALHAHRLAVLSAPTNGFETVWVGDRTAPLAEVGADDLDLQVVGDATQHVIWRLENGELEGYSAKRFVVRVGAHNSPFDQPPGGVENGLRKIRAVIAARHPTAEIVVKSNWKKRK